MAWMRIFDVTVTGSCLALCLGVCFVPLDKMSQGAVVTISLLLLACLPIAMLEAQACYGRPQGPWRVPRQALWGSGLAPWQRLTLLALVVVDIAVVRHTWTLLNEPGTPHDPLISVQRVFAMVPLYFSCVGFFYATLNDSARRRLQGRSVPT